MVDLSWYTLTDAEREACAFPTLPDGKIYGWLAKGGKVYSGNGYPVLKTQFNIDRHACVALLIQGSATPPIPAPIAERMIDLILAISKESGRFQGNAQQIMGELNPVDNDLIEARKVASSLYSDGRNSLVEANILSGLRDDGMDVSIALAAIRKGRELQKDEK